MTFRLQLEGRSVELSAEQLGAFRDSLPASLDEPHQALPRETLQALFESHMIDTTALAPVQNQSRWIAAFDSVALSPFLSFEVRFVAPGVILSGDEPVVGVFQHPEISITAQGINEVLRSCLRHAMQASAVTGRVFPRDQAGALIQAAVAKWLRNAHDAPIHWECDGAALTLKLDASRLIESRSPHPAWAVSIMVKCRSSTEEVVVPVEALAQLGGCIDALDRRDPSGWAIAVSSPHVRRILGAIEAVDGLVDLVERPKNFALQVSHADAMAITHMGHASLIVDCGDSRILIDPWLHAWDDSYACQPVTRAELGEVSAICFSHHHADHMEPGSLLALPRDVPVFVPRPTGRTLEPQTADYLRAFGFTDVREIGHGDCESLECDLEVEAVPFFGEGSDRLGFGGNCYLLSRLGRNALIYADASPDSHGESLLSQGRLRELVERRGPIDVIFGTWWQERTFRCFLSTYAAILPENHPANWLENNELTDCQPEYIDELVRVAGASLYVAYAQSGSERFKNEAARSSYVPSVSLLWTPLAEMREQLSTSGGAELLEAEPYTTVVLSADGPRVETRLLAG